MSRNRVRIVGTALAATALLGGIAAVPALATAGDTNPRVCTAKEYKAVKNGMSKQQVARILDGPGSQSLGYSAFGTRYETRDYGKISWRTTMCSVDFEDGRVVGKFRI